MSGFYVGTDELEAIQRRMGGTRKQLLLAYNTALRKTLAQLRREAVAMMIDLTGVKNKKDLGKRIQIHRIGGQSGKLPASGKLWFGLSGMPVSLIDGDITQPAERERERDNRGRFVRGRGDRGVTFTPASSALSPVTFLDAFYGVFRGQEKLYERIPGSQHLREARLPIADEVMSKIDRGIFRKANTILMFHFQKELEGLIARGYGV
ncbi:hypothetical protein RVW00_000765 [Enterobacter bugandensis]|nr:hypothetical protein [Enterobacter bugandensis]